ncbi:YdcH family protein [Citreimonas salinaria]|uniref:DUF465 domain-containing protein n=1 Tax=Citreimonas salinaria TaxID=321339 RepID=A0A1H3M1P4_9RHOB|nr:YdcH family protein [Citreimonas salinaria]SDY70631.1 hypothetical protein SAMN05444340_11563 [Citreimonas salinaria]
MTDDARLASLRTRHASIDAEIERLQKHPGADELHIADLKKQKLVVKEEMVRLEQDEASAD